MNRMGDWRKDSAQEARRVAEFLSGSGRRLVFRVDCPLESRIRYIYRAIFPGLGLPLFYLRFMVARIAQLSDYSPVKIFLYRLIGVRIGRGVFISPDAFIDPHFPSLITLGDHAILGWGTRIFAHDFDGTKYSMGRVDIGKGAVIGAFTVVKNGVSIGDGVFIHLCGLVMRDVLTGSRYGPDRVLKAILGRKRE